MHLWDVSELLWISGTIELADSERLHNLTDAVQANQLSFRHYLTDIDTITRNWLPNERFWGAHSQHNQAVLAGCHKKRISKKHDFLCCWYRNWFATLKPNLDRMHICADQVGSNHAQQLRLMSIFYIRWRFWSNNDLICIASSYYRSPSSSIVSINSHLFCTAHFQGTLPISMSFFPYHGFAADYLIN